MTGMNKLFQFKQFTIEQDQCAMKVGTDGILLGAWASIDKEPISILDIGAGTGVIALMLAQRSHADLIDAIEIDENAYEQCVDNFENSPWGDRVFCYHASLEEFVTEIADKYDLIVSNPPFYTSQNKSDNSQRNLARFEDALPFHHLLGSVSQLLSSDGTFCVVIPYSEKKKFISLAEEFKLHASKVLDVKGNPISEFKRSLLEFRFQKKTTQVEELIIEKERHMCTQEFIALTKEFYLKL